MKTDNELIAEFMGFSKCETPDDTFWKENGEECTIHSWDFHSFGLKFDSSWDWLMPVVEKIHKSKTYITWYSKEPVGVDISIHPNACSFDLPDTSQGYDYVDGCYQAPSLFCYNAMLQKDMITCVYKCCIEFIKWYNSQNPKP